MNHGLRRSGGTLPSRSAEAVRPVVTQIPRDCRLMSCDGLSAIGSVMTGGVVPPAEVDQPVDRCRSHAEIFSLWSEPGANFRPVRTICEPSQNAVRPFINLSILRHSGRYLSVHLVRTKFARYPWQPTGNALATKKRQKTAVSQKYALATCEPNRELPGGRHA
jgi:hypothetical protein